jgi:hypothetical protein
MKRSRGLVRPLILGGLLASWIILACSVDDSNPVVGRRDLVSLYADTGAAGDGALVEGAPICSTYGGKPNAEAIALAVLAMVKTDCRLVNTMVTTVSDNHAIQCWQAFVAASFECDGAKLANGTTDNDGNPCTRPIGDTLSDEDFVAFVEDYQATLLAKGVSQADVNAVLPSLESAKTLVVGNDVPGGKYTGCAANCKDAGGIPFDAGACNRPAPPKDSGTDTGAKDSGPKDSGAKDTGSPPVDSGASDADADT